MKDEKQLIYRLLAVHESFAATVRDRATGAAGQPLTTAEIFAFLTRRAQFELETTLAAQDLVEHWAQTAEPSLLETDGDTEGPKHKARIIAAVDAIGPRQAVSTWLTQHVQDCVDRETQVKADPASADTPAFSQTYESERADVDRILGDVLAATKALHVWNQERSAAAWASAFMQAGMNQPGAATSDDSYTHPDGTVVRTLSVTFNRDDDPGAKPRWRRRKFRR